MKYQFPEGFWWGSASSAAQMEGASQEGGKGSNVWDYWYTQEPNVFYNGVGPQTVTDFYHRYEEDIKLMKEFGHNSFRTSISWSRLIPEGKGEINQEAVKFYNNVIDQLIANEIEPFMALFHFDMPWEMQKIGGFENRDVVEAYKDYAGACFKLFGDRVKYWFTFNEPIVPVEGGYLNQTHYPRKQDFKAAVQVTYNTMIAQAKAIEEYKKQHQSGKIGVILNLSPVYPRSDNPFDEEAAYIADLFHNRSFLDPSIKGEYPEKLIEIIKRYNLMPDIQPGDKELIRQNTIQILGVNYYSPRRVKAKETLPNPYSPITPEWFYDNYEMPGRKMNPYRGWEIYEKGIYDIMIRIRDEYGDIERYVSENGMGVENEDRFIKDGMVQDDYRIEFVKEHLKWLYRSIQEGCNVKGYHMWTFIDNWSWLNAFKNRYGFISLDLKTLKRTPKKSAYWFKEMTKNNGFEE
ncbi:glycoside hydrolase family 1 protein [Calorimonas adulescens]|uniref:Glycoside hydrolase family 1 protein n=1 Tax=Calorimonas adulescens TaxID=2606906 RepID=A0A5D8QCB4_9THEO|nr:glycoside hydrolase family 1 protein [Calorimonas adulescens]TZE80968.1 glycoside hydrolase family 1 protein [Calorimonas adulescens]